MDFNIFHCYTGFWCCWVIQSDKIKCYGRAWPLRWHKKEDDISPNYTFRVWLTIINKDSAIYIWIAMWCIVIIVLFYSSFVSDGWETCTTVNGNLSNCHQLYISAAVDLTETNSNSIRGITCLVHTDSIIRLFTVLIPVLPLGIVSMQYSTATPPIGRVPLPLVGSVHSTIWPAPYWLHC